MGTKEVAASKACRFSFSWLSPEVYRLWILKILQYNRKDNEVKKNNKNNQEVCGKNSMLLLFYHSLFSTLNDVINAAEEFSEVCMLLIQLPCLECTMLYSSIVF